jgi:hypothetical protein
VPPNLPQDEETRRPTNSPRPKAEGTARRAAMAMKKSKFTEAQNRLRLDYLTENGA